MRGWGGQAGTSKGSRSLLQALRSSGRRGLGVELRRPRPLRRHWQNASGTQTRRLLAVNRVHPSSPASRSCILWGAVQVAAPPAGCAQEPGRASGLQPGVENVPVRCRASGPRRRLVRGRREGPSLSGAEAADTPRSLFRTWATAEVARSAVWCAGLTPGVVGEPQLFMALQGPG
ncbi:hypothetical protein NDU88_003271 [Pleurodeles waltl]|uniref:Uncharacterized protein n=1 Tax=Pleurodeles waltl TaxID=8319 RepID=A0AAV7WT58_PLEWA|nr:hypothetical protein NDU88_003271 [Pleurodeles waltl]